MKKLLAMIPAAALALGTFVFTPAARAQVGLLSAVKVDFYKRNPIHDIQGFSL